MPDTAIKIIGLGKQYRIGTRAQKYDTLRDRIAALATAPFRRLAAGGLASTTTIWALRDISHEIKRGEVVGVIGGNGAGKSTLLKILSRITEPTEGEVEIHGRVGSLLEVGTGFHPDLTGRENIFLNGAILGMRRAEIQRKFADIVRFAEIDDFIDTPVRHYSSGMYVRLGFAVAAHMEPEILIVDEVLAVGDAQFQRKCLGKLDDVARSGRTVLFVSHNMAAIQRLCTSALLLQRGRLVRSIDRGGISRRRGARRVHRGGAQWQRTDSGRRPRGRGRTTARESVLHGCCRLPYPFRAAAAVARFADWYRGARVRWNARVYDQYRGCRRALPLERG
jgi:lipopolysaccharide transport system ATP-binding protein